MDKSIGKTGSASIKKVGHTFSGRFGIDPNAQTKGPSGSTDITFGS